MRPGVRRAVDRAGYKVALLMDGGIRRGSDVFKALGRGADAVLVGRPVLWGLAVNGQGGVTQVLNLLNGGTRTNHDTGRMCTAERHHAGSAVRRPVFRIFRLDGNGPALTAEASSVHTSKTVGAVRNRS